MMDGWYTETVDRQAGRNAEMNARQVLETDRHIVTETDR